MPIHFAVSLNFCPYAPSRSRRKYLGALSQGKASRKLNEPSSPLSGSRYREMQGTSALGSRITKTNRSWERNRWDDEEICRDQIHCMVLENGAHDCEGGFLRAGPCTWRPFLVISECRVSRVRRECEEHHSAGWRGSFDGSRLWNDWRSATAHCPSPETVVACIAGGPRSRNQFPIKSDPSNEPRQPALWCSSHSRRTLETRHSDITRKRSPSTWSAAGSHLRSRGAPFSRTMQWIWSLQISSSSQRLRSNSYSSS